MVASVICLCVRGGLCWFTYLLFHLAHLELVGAELGVVDLLLVLLAVLDHALHLAHERSAGRTDGLARRLEVLLALAHEAGLDTAGGDELGCRGSHVVGRDDEVLRAVTVREHAVRRLDERVGRRRDGFGRRDETLGPPVVLLVKGLSRGRAPARLHNLLLCHRCRLDELRDGVGHSHGRIEDRVVDLEFLLIHDVAEVALARQFACAGRKCLDKLVQLLEVHLHIIVAVDDNVRLLDRVHAFETEALETAEELDGCLRRLSGAVEERVAALLVRREAREALGVAAHIGNGTSEDVDCLDKLGLIERIIHALDTRLQHRVDDVVNLVKIGHDERINLAVQGVVRLALILSQLVELDEGLVHARLVNLELLLLVAEKLLNVSVAVGDLGVIRFVEGHAELALELLNLVLAAARRAVLVVKGTISFPDHLLASLYRLGSRGCLELHRLELVEEVEVLGAKLGVQLGECLVLCPPGVDLLLQGCNLVIATRHLLAVVALDLGQLVLQSLHPLIVLLQHQLVLLVLRPCPEVLLLELGQPSLGLVLHLLLHQRLLLALLLLHELSLLFLKVPLGLQRSLLLSHLLCVLPLLEHSLLLLVLPVLAVEFALPELVHVVWLLRLWLGYGRGVPFNLLLGPCRQCRSLVILGA
ncbi:hypothetical protein BN1708_008289 [Verticillium longisporum]|uniref:Uncharacterized protein n=1 Tax=Verticillium longisporum TaxID=100787 RepID=A0A0G4N2L1_VERLO|nr:hypothetical protein BN1708_008289 [Verticillium longisporum]